jgi:hypothetical protein
MELESHGLLALPMGKKAICINSPGGSLGGLSGDVPVTKNPWWWLFWLERATMEAKIKI